MFHGKTVGKKKSASTLVILNNAWRPADDRNEEVIRTILV